MNPRPFLVFNHLCSIGIHNDLISAEGIDGVDVEDCYPIAPGILRDVEVADHLHFDGLALLGSWRLECEVPDVIQRSFLICRSYDVGACYIGVHNKAVFIDDEAHLQLNGRAIVVLTNLEVWCRPSVRLVRGQCPRSPASLQPMKITF